MFTRSLIELPWTAKPYVGVFEALGLCLFSAVVFVFVSVLLLVHLVPLVAFGQCILMQLSLMLSKLLYELRIPCSKKSSKFPLQLEKMLHRQQIWRSMVSAVSNSTASRHKKERAVA